MRWRMERVLVRMAAQNENYLVRDAQSNIISMAAEIEPVVAQRAPQENQKGYINKIEHKRTSITASVKRRLYLPALTMVAGN